MPIKEFNQLHCFSISKRDENETEPKKVYLAGLSDSISKEMIENCFSKFGPIVDVFLNPTQDVPNYKKWGIVTYDSELSARKALVERDIELGSILISARPCNKSKR